MVNTQKKISKSLDTFEEKMIRELEKAHKSLEKNHQAAKNELKKREENIKSYFRQHRRVMSKFSESVTEETSSNSSEDMKFYPPEIYRPFEFVANYVMDEEEERLDFVHHYFEARFGDHYRGDRHGTCWELKKHGSYGRCTFEEILDWLGPLEHQFNKCLTDPRDYKDEVDDAEFFERLRRWWLEAATENKLKLGRGSLKKFLVYKHMNLKPLRKQLFS